MLKLSFGKINQPSNGLKIDRQTSEPCLFLAVNPSKEAIPFQVFCSKQQNTHHKGEQWRHALISSWHSRVFEITAKNVVIVVKKNELLLKNDNNKPFKSFRKAIMTLLKDENDNEISETLTTLNLTAELFRHFTVFHDADSFSSLWYQIYSYSWIRSIERNRSAVFPLFIVIYIEEQYMCDIFVYLESLLVYCTL